MHSGEWIQDCLGTKWGIRVSTLQECSFRFHVVVVIWIAAWGWLDWAVLRPKFYLVFPFTALYVPQFQTLFPHPFVSERAVWMFQHSGHISISPPPPLPLPYLSAAARKLWILVHWQMLCLIFPADCIFVFPCLQPSNLSSTVVPSFLSRVLLFPSSEHIYNATAPAARVVVSRVSFLRMR